MTDHEDKAYSRQNCFWRQQSWRKLWSCLLETCSRSLIVLVPNFLSFCCLFLMASGGSIHLSKTCDQSTVWLGVLCSAAGCFLPSTRLWTSYFLQNVVTLYHWSALPRREVHNLSINGSKMEVFEQKLSIVLSSSHFTMLCEKRLKVLSLIKLYTLKV